MILLVSALWVSPKFMGYCGSEQSISFSGVTLFIQFSFSPGCGLFWAACSIPRIPAQAEPWWASRGPVQRPSKRSLFGMNQRILMPSLARTIPTRTLIRTTMRTFEVNFGRYTNARLVITSKSFLKNIRATWTSFLYS